MNKDTLEFVTYCIGSLSRILHLPQREVYNKLKQSGILYGYIVPSYDVLHTFGSRYLMEDLIDLLGLRKHLEQRIDELSGGQKQRVAIARTLVLKPRLLLLDEPLSALDGIIKESIKERIRTVARQYKLTTLIVTHDPEEALTLSDRVLIINEGKIAQFADPQTIISHPANDFVGQFILSQLNIKRSNILKLFSDSLEESSPASTLIAKPQPFQGLGQAVA